MKEIVTAILMASVLSTVIYLMLLCFQLKRSLRFTVFVYMLTIAIHTIADWAVAHFEIMNIYAFREIFQLIYIPLSAVLLKGCFFQKVFVYFLLQAIATTILSVSYIFAWIFFMPYGEFWHWLAFLAITLIMLAAYIAMARKFGICFIKRMFEYGSPKEWALYALNMGISFSAIEITFIFLSRHFAIDFLFVFFVFSSIIFLFFAIISRHEKAKQKHEADFAHGIITASQNHYRRMSEIYDKLRIMRHDYKYHLNTIGKLANDENISEIRKYLLDLQEQFRDVPEITARYGGGENFLPTVTPVPQVDG
ncbi:MAG: hypothetical protein LBB36_01200 [Fibromonadaceae bacterium]|jgi:hypothetical protein|nr:hypothetical protein [Fibromonadaceae bacterium]